MTSDRINHMTEANMLNPKSDIRDPKSKESEIRDPKSEIERIRNPKSEIQSPFRIGKTLCMAHRGFTQSAPENSMAAFRGAIEMGADGIELDVRTCKTGEVIVFHDPVLARMTNGRGFVKNKSLAELRELRLKSSYPDSECIPTLEEVLQLTRGKISVNVEIKTNGLPKNGIEEKVVEILRRYEVESETIVSSFNPIVVRRVRKLGQDLITGYLIDKNIRMGKTEIPLTRFAGANAIHLQQTLAREKLLRRIHDSGFFSVIWSVNDTANMQQFIDLGVHAIISDQPDKLRKLLAP